MRGSAGRQAFTHAQNSLSLQVFCEPKASLRRAGEMAHRLKCTLVKDSSSVLSSFKGCKYNFQNKQTNSTTEQNKNYSSGEREGSTHQNIFIPKSEDLSLILVIYMVKEKFLQVACWPS